MTLWYEGPLAAFGAATTGRDAEGDRIVSAALVTQEAPDRAPRVRAWLVDPGVPVPGTHGLTDDFLHRNGRWPAPVVEEIGRALGGACAAGVPLVVPHASYGLTVVDRELWRHRASRLARYVEPAPLCVLDPWVLDGHLHHRGPGRTGIAELCARYGVEAADARDPAASALAALEVTRAVGRRFAARLGRLTAIELHRLQGAWHIAATRRPLGWFAGGGTRARTRAAEGWPLPPDLPATAG
ncbi:3'-5' exonuclease [Streptomyces sp. 8L]|uniref:3'-5' exonuclease n=1 Tax=Streptomyces sp. 8L TaxID=2877242 RepID=UPI001CD5E4F7|nr:3'-5' exonuclease [Streptomyces sp. 8L]MCA1219399.1 3'-5' exonuclease [Streptomyces sp. 8L]